jgi:Helicase conserved C-terminal domain
MSEHKGITPTNSHGETNDGFSLVSSVPTEAQPLILYDLATVVGSVYQQRITLTKQGTVTKRFASLLCPLLHGSPWNDERREDAYVNMLCEAAKQLGLIYRSFSYEEDEHKPYYCPSIESGLEKWSRINAYEQARQFLAWWQGSVQWHDTWSPDFRQWDSGDWNPLAARSLLFDLLSSPIYVPGRWYSISSLLDMIWSRGPYLLRPAYLKERTRTQSIPSWLRRSWDSCEGIVYRGILSSTLSELGIISTDRRAGDSKTGASPLPTRFGITTFGAQVLFGESTASTARPIKALVVQPSFEMILLRFDSPTVYQLLPFSEVKLVEQVSRLILTQNSVLRGIERGMSVDQMLAILKKFSKQAVPQNVTRTLKDWGKTYKEAETTQVLLIEVSSEGIADELCLSPRWQAFGIEKIAPCRLLALNVHDTFVFRRLLRRAGFVLRS